MSDAGLVFSVTEEADFLFRINYSPCQDNGRALARLVPEFETDLLVEEERVHLAYSIVTNPDNNDESLQVLSESIVAWDAKLLGIPPELNERTTAAGPNGYGRCNIYGTWEPSGALVHNYLRAPSDQLFDDFFDATLIEVNEGAYDYVPWLTFTDNVIGIAAYGDCEEASGRAADYLDRSIARMDGWGVDRPITYRLFLPEQVEGLSENEIDRAWEAGEIEPLGPTNAE